MTADSILATIKLLFCTGVLANYLMTLATNRILGVNTTKCHFESVPNRKLCLNFVPCVCRGSRAEL